MRSFVVALVLTVALTMVVPAPSQAQVPGNATLAGFVCIDGDGCWRGVPGAQVVLTRPGVVSALDDRRTATTDEQGTFWFSQLQEGEYRLQVSRTGFESVTMTVQTGDQVEAPLKAQTVTFNGSVTDPEGKKVPAKVEFWGLDGYQSFDAPQGTFSATVTAGYWHFNVRASGLRTFSEERLVDGSALTIAMQALPPPDATIQGVVRDQHGVGVQGADVRAYQYGEEYYELFARTDNQGRYSLGVYRGDVYMDVQKEGHAGAWANVYVKDQKTVEQDFELLKYPPKTAHIVGRFIDAETGKPLSSASLNVQSPRYGLYECSTYGGSKAGHGAPEPMMVEDRAMSYPYPYPGCAITVRDDGTFEGNVTPGYSILNVWYDVWRTCSETRGSDGSYQRTCGPDYYPYVMTTVLKDGENRLTIALKPRPAPDATVSGWVVDVDTQKAIPRAQVSFQLQDGYGWGEATTDQDGSYKVKLRSGYVHVYVWADGYLPWQGVLEVKKGAVPFDIMLTTGETRYGGCCYAYGHDMAVAESAPASGIARPATASGPPPPAMPVAGPSGSGGSAVGYEDLGGGLGQYDPQKRSQQLSDGNDSPGFAPMLVVAALAGLAAWRRRTP